MGNEKWCPGQLVKEMGTTDYRVVDDGGRETQRHIDQLRQRSRSALIYPTSTVDRSSLEVERLKASEVARSPPDTVVETQVTQSPLR